MGACAHLLPHPAGHVGGLCLAAVLDLPAQRGLPRNQRDGMHADETAVAASLWCRAHRGEARPLPGGQSQRNQRDGMQAAFRQRLHHLFGAAAHRLEVGPPATPMGAAQSWVHKTDHALCTNARCVWLPNSSTSRKGGLSRSKSTAFPCSPGLSACPRPSSPQQQRSAVQPQPPPRSEQELTLN